MNYGTLPVTGATATAFGVTFDQLWIVAAGLGLVAIAAVVTRFSFRRGKTPLDI